MDIFHDGRRIGQAVANLFRPDVAAALSSEANCGFGFVLPAALRAGQMPTLSVRAAVNGEELRGSPMQVHVQPAAAISRLNDLFEEVNRVCAQSYAVRDRLKQLLDTDEFSVLQYSSWAASYFARLRSPVCSPSGGVPGGTPLVSVACPVYRPEPAALDATICSVRRQTYANWELILVDDGGKSEPVTRVLEWHAREDKRVRLLAQSRNRGISITTNAAVAAARATMSRSSITTTCWRMSPSK